MKLIIAGGRDYQFTESDIEFIRSLHMRQLISEVVSGVATGADKCGEKWAIDNNIPVKFFPAKWNEHGKSACPIRNRQMAQYADSVVLFPGGNGTSNMRIEALKAGLIVYDRSHEGAME